MSLDHVAGRSYGPYVVDTSEQRAARFVAATGDDADRWRSTLPPSYASAALFSAAPAFLGDPDVVPFTRSLIHTEQRFTWHRSASIGEEIEVEGKVEKVKARSGLNFVTFVATARGSGAPWLDSTSLFLMSDRAAAMADEQAEPEHSAKAVNDPAALTPLPAAGQAIPQLRRSASREDLVRYAAATEDFNAIHWDHEAARAAGLARIVCHGLLALAWMVQATARFSPVAHPLASISVRFRKPIYPSAQATVGGTVAGGEGSRGIDISVSVGDVTAATGRVEVTG